MTTTVDSNILSALFSNEAGASLISGALFAAGTRGTVWIHAAVYAELLAAPGMQQATLETFLHDTGVQVDWDTPVPLWTQAGLAFQRYALRRARSGGGVPRRILADFLVGAHALSHGAVLLTADPRHYRLAFPALRLETP